MKGKALVTQPKGNTAELLTDLVLKLNGMSYQSLSKANFQAAYTDAVSMMKDGHVQVFTLGTTAPASAVMDLASARDVKLVPVDDKTMASLRKENPGYHPLTIKAGKRIIREVLKPDSEIDMEMCRRLILDCFESEDYTEGRRAFMEKRKPVFKGK
jgi:TRAP-type uncharacterized transport system substrate-binding protein